MTLALHGTLSQRAVRDAVAAVKVEARRELLSRRPDGLRDATTEEESRRIATSSMAWLGESDEAVERTAIARLRYLGDLAFDALVAGLKKEYGRDPCPCRGTAGRGRYPHWRVAHER